MKTKLNLTASVLLALVFLAGCGNKKTKLLLPVYGEKKVENNDTVYHRIGSFNFMNQFGEKISNETVKNKIYVADFFFATCQSICPVMSTNLKDVQKAFENDDSLLILSHSVNPMHDTVQVLNDYGLTYGAKKGKWHLLTGNKKEIYDLAKDSYLVNAIQDDGSPEGFLHSELFILVDKQGRIRGMYDGTDKASISKLIEDIKLLKNEK
jgi:protein SCO1/2